MATPVFYRWWITRHLEKVDQARHLGHAIDLLLVGDSITQNYERTSPNPQYNFKPAIDAIFTSHRVMNLGMNGDRTENVLWRLRHGEVDGLAPREIVLLIGINNISDPRRPAPAQITEGVIAIAAELHQRMPGARITVMALLPTAFPPERQRVMMAVNEGLHAWVGQTAYAHWLDASDLFFNGSGLRAELYYDSAMGLGFPALHPNLQGQRLLAERLVETLYSSKR